MSLLQTQNIFLGFYDTFFETMVGDKDLGGYTTQSKTKIKVTTFNNIIVPTFDTKVTEYLCSGWFFFFRQSATF